MFVTGKDLDTKTMSTQESVLISEESAPQSLDNSGENTLFL